jgi:hypothetical protein
MDAGHLEAGAPLKEFGQGGSSGNGGGTATNLKAHGGDLSRFDAYGQAEQVAAGGIRHLNDDTR